MQRRTFNTVLAALGLALSVSSPAASAAWPEGKPISIVVPYAPGGTADALARPIATHLGPRGGTAVGGINTPCVPGGIGPMAGPQAPPDRPSAPCDDPS